MIILMKAQHRIENPAYKYRDFEIIMTGEKISPLPTGEKYACTIFDIQRISTDESVIKDARSIFHEYTGNDAEETFEKAIKEAEEWIEKTYF